MKKLFTLLFVLTLSGMVSAQNNFWVETFSNSCSSGCTTYSGPNGAWTFTDSSPSTDECGGDVTPNGWRISYTESGRAAGLCHANGTNPTLHISNDVNSPSASFCPSGDCGASYDAGGYCGAYGLDFGSVYTDIMAQSPVINCSGKTNITLSFNYMEGGQAAHDYATLWYYNGSSWAQLSGLAMHNCWTKFSMTMPVGAENNSAVKIGFKWVNDDDLQGNDPSFAVDSIMLTVPSSGLPPVAKITYADSVGCNPFCINSFADNSTNSPTSWLWTFDGGNPSSSTLQSPGTICYPNAGTFNVKLKVTNGAGTDSITVANKVQVYTSPTTPTISRHGADTLCSSTDIAYTSYQWLFGSSTVGSTPCIKINNGSGAYTVKVKNINNCEVASQITVGIPNYFYAEQVSIFPNPATSELTVKGAWQSATGTLSVYDILGERVKEYVVKLEDKVVVNVKDLSDGVYFLQIVNDRGRYTGKFMKN